MAIQVMVIEPGAVNVAFLARMTSDALNVLGDNSNYTVVFGTEVLDIGNNYNNTTGVFTAPLNGMYVFTTTLWIYQIGTAHKEGILYINTPTKSYLLFDMNPTAIKDPYTQTIIAGSIVVRLDAGETAYVVVRVSGGTKVVDIMALNSCFSGALVAAF